MGRLGGGGAGFCDIMQRQVLQSCFDPGCASDSVHRQSGRCTRWRASCASLCCAQRQVPTVLFLVSLSWVRNAVALWRLVKDFHIFSSCCSRSSPGIWTLFLEPLVLAATCPCALRQSTESSGRISSIFYVKSGLGSPCSSHLEIWNYFYEQYLAVTACVSLRAFGRISHIFIVLVVPAPRAVRT